MRIKRLKAIITNRISLDGIPDNLKHAIRQRLTMVNPKWNENERMGWSNYKTPRLLRDYERAANGALSVPRGYGGHLVILARQFDTRIDYDDRRRTLGPISFSLKASLRGYQTDAVTKVCKQTQGVLTAPTGSGKTVMGLAIVAERKQPTLIVVHTKELLHQWIDRIETFLGIPAGEIGIIGGGKYRIGEKMTVALVQSLYKRAEEVTPHIGHLIVDECHRCPSRTFTEAVTSFDCKYTLGLSATPWRRDKLSRLIFWHLGDVVAEVDKAQLEDAGHILKAEFITRQTIFKPFSDPSDQYAQMLKELTADELRNTMICSDVAANLDQGTALVLSDRKEHCVTLQAMLQERFGISAAVLTGDTPIKKREELVQDINNGQVPALVATGQLIGEGFDCKHLSTLFLSTPIKFSGRVLQYVGRVLRPAEGKATPKVFDYVDAHVGPLIAAAKARQRVYRDAAQE